MALPVSDPTMPTPLRLALRRPSAAERTCRAGLRLTPRDDEILAALALHRLLTVAHLERACFPPAGEVRKAFCSHAYERVRLLWRWGFLHRCELPRMPGRAGRPPSLWALAPAGARRVAALGRSDLPTARGVRPERISPLFLAHDLQVAWCWASLRALLHARRIAGLRWTPESRLRARRTRVLDPATGRRLPVLPDAYLEIAYPDGRVQAAMLEVDMDTVPDDDFRAKLVALEIYRASGGFARDHGRASFETLVLAPTEERLDQLWALGRTSLPAAAWRWFSLATFAVLAPGCLDDPGWRNLADERTGLLYDREE